MKGQQSQTDSGDQTSNPSGYLTPYFQNNFPKTFDFLPLKKNLGCLERGVNEICVNCVTNCVMLKIWWQSDLHGKITLHMYKLYVI